MRLATRADYPYQDAVKRDLADSGPFVYASSDNQSQPVFSAFPSMAQHGTFAMDPEGANVVLAEGLPRWQHLPSHIEAMAAEQSIMGTGDAYSVRTSRVLFDYDTGAPTHAPSQQARGQWLIEALAVLEGCPAEASEEGLREPSKYALAAADIVLRRLATHVAEAPDVYPMPDGEIAVDLRNPDEPYGVLFVAEATGGVACIARTRGTSAQMQAARAEDVIAEGSLGLLAEAGIR